MAPQPQSGGIGLTEEQNQEMYRQVEAGYLASQGQLDETVRRDLNRMGASLHREAAFARDMRITDRELRQTLTASNTTALDKALRNVQPPEVRYADVVPGGLYMQFAPEVYERGMAAIARRKSPAGMMGLTDEEYGRLRYPTRTTFQAEAREALQTAGAYAKEYFIGAVDAFARAGYYQTSEFGTTMATFTGLEYQSPFAPAATNELQLARDLGPTALVFGGVLAGKLQSSLMSSLSVPTNRGLISDEWVTAYRVDTSGFPARVAIGSDQVAEVPVILTRVGDERALFLNFDQPARAKEFLEVNRSGNGTITAVEVNKAFLEDLRLRSITETEASRFRNTTSPVRVDRAFPDQYGLRTSEDIQRFREAIRPGSARLVDPDGL